MNQKKLFSGIIIGSFIAYMVVSIISIIIFFMFGMNYDENGFVGLQIFSNFNNFVFTIPFFVLIIIYFREDKTLLAFSILAIVSKLSYTLFTSLLYSESYDTVFRIIMGASTVASIGAMLAAFGIILQGKYGNKLANSLFAISIIYFIFESTSSLSILYLFSVLVSDSIIQIVHYILIIEVVVLQVVAIRQLVDFKSNYKGKKRKIVYSISALRDAKKLEEEVIEEK